MLAIACRVLLHHSVSQPVTMDDTWPVYIGIVGFLVGSAAVVVQHGVRLRQRLIGPEQRMRDVLAALRSGDLSPRVHLRGGDLLHGLADDLNHTIEWLNRNPPQGATPGGDVLDVDHHDEIELDESQWDAVVNGGSHARG